MARDTAFHRRRNQLGSHFKIRERAAAASTCVNSIGFAVDPKSLPAEVSVDRINLNDQTVEGMRHKNKTIFCVQYHPEASPGPTDSHYLFDRFVSMIDESKKQ